MRIETCRQKNRNVTLWLITQSFINLFPFCYARKHHREMHAKASIACQLLQHFRFAFQISHRCWRFCAANACRSCETSSVVSMSTSCGALLTIWQTTGGGAQHALPNEYVYASSFPRMHFSGRHHSYRLWPC